ncbi:MAG: methyltransferase domain-containing protein, partial [Methanobacterium paludis]|nr:methyltransferase domain-containing protein [Methanobacterium paludis]
KKIIIKLRPLIRLFYRIYGKMALLSPINHFKISKIKNEKSLKLNMGCGNVKLIDWVNIDIEPGADLIVDLRKGLPFKNNSIDFIYNEHFIEHLKLEDGQKVLNEFYRVLKNGGVLRIATPDLDYILTKYSEGWRDQDWLSWPEYDFIMSKGQMINISFRWWGHEYLYNEDDLKHLLMRAGFRSVIRCELKESTYSELKNLETRKDSNLILEAKK